MDRPIRILFLADSHLGIDLPSKPRIVRRRRGHDFLANHTAALTPALAGDVDVVIHGGDVFDRPRVSASVAHQAYYPLLRVAEKGVPVYIVPGNHERGQLPHARFLARPRIHVFDGARTFRLSVRGVRITLTGFPFERSNVRTRFPDLLERTRWQDTPADVRLLCVHHCIEGATVGPGDYTFTTAADVIRCRDLPSGFTAVLSGHIHRHQVLTRDLRGSPLSAPVLYPGSIERTSAAEIGEDKGWLMLEVDVTGAAPRLSWTFHRLPARPMIVHRVSTHCLSGSDLDRVLRATVASAPSDAVLRIRVEGALSDAHLRVISGAHVRSYAPESMNVEVHADELMRLRRVPAPGGMAASTCRLDENLQLGL